LWAKEFVIHSDHESLKHIRSQGKLNRRHAKWVEFIESFPYVIKHKKGKENIIADALYRRYTLLNELDCKIFGLETIKDQYVNDADFKEVLLHCKDGKGWNKFIFNDGFVFRANKLCIPASFVHLLLLLQEAHGGGLMGHFGAKKTKDILAGHFFWPKMRRDVERFVARCTTCQKAKSRLHPDGLRRRCHRLKNYFGHTRWNSYVTWVKWELVWACLDIVLILTKDRCTVCTKCTIGSKIILDAPYGTPM
jgi:hypothetical protein